MSISYFTQVAASRTLSMLAATESQNAVVMHLRRVRKLQDDSNLKSYLRHISKGEEVMLYFRGISLPTVTAVTDDI